MKKEEVDIIETNIMFGVDIKVNVKVRKTTSYGNLQPEYKLAEVAGVAIQSDMLDENTKIDIRKNIIKNIREEAFVVVKEYEEDLKKRQK